MKSTTIAVYLTSVLFESFGCLLVAVILTALKAVIRGNWPFLPRDVKLFGYPLICAN